MAVALPVIAAFGAGAAGVAAIGAATTTLGIIAGYATVAGAVLTGVGALTGKKDLMKIGAVIGIAGGIGSMVSNAGNTAASATGAGGAVDEIVAETAQQAGAAATPAAGVAGDVVSAAGNVPTVAPTMDTMATGAFDAISGGAGAAPGIADAPSIMSKLAPAAESVPSVAPSAIPSAMQEGAQGLTMKDISSWFDKAKAIPKWIEANPTLAKVGGEALVGMYGPGAEQNDLLRQQQEYQQSLMERARANLNSPIRIQRNGRP